MSEKLLTLPIGIQSFEKLRQGNYLYVDKTDGLLELITSSPWCFLSRPRRFGKSLTLSTLDAMFSGKAELFKGLTAEEWVKYQSKHPAPVLRFDMSRLGTTASPKGLDKAIVADLKDIANDHELILTNEEHEEEVGETECSRMLKSVIRALYKAGGPVVVLIDEYDKPMLDNIGDLNKANAMRMILRSFYTVLKSCDEYLRFVMLTGISKFSKTGVFSAMNNLEDISMDRQYGDIVGYTQDELQENFSAWIDSAADRMNLSRVEFLDRLKDYYDGFCFDGKTKLYNPFSMMQCLKKGEIANYWYESGSPSFIVEYMKQHGIKDPEQYSGISVEANFMNSQEIECADPASFLYQAGYLTISAKEEQELTLDYPNREVRDSIASMYLKHVYHVKSYSALGSQLWKAIKAHDMAKVVELYNIALAGIPYDDYDRHESLVPTAVQGDIRVLSAADQGESWYRSMFLMLLRGAGITGNGEAHTNRGRPDVIAQFPEQVVVFEFKYAKESSDIKSKRTEGEQQIVEKNYVKQYGAEGRTVTTAVIVIDGKRREAIL